MSSRGSLDHLANQTRLNVTEHLQPNADVSLNSNVSTVSSITMHHSESSARHEQPNKSRSVRVSNATIPEADYVHIIFSFGKVYNKYQEVIAT